MEYDDKRMQGEFNLNFSCVFFLVFRVSLLTISSISTRSSYEITIIPLNVSPGPVKIHRKPSTKQPAQIIKPVHIMDHS